MINTQYFYVGYLFFNMKLKGTMMKSFLVFGTFLLMVGCASTVKTYDVRGNMIGSCVSQASLLSKKMAMCTGYGNQQGYVFVPVSVKQLEQERLEQIKLPLNKISGIPQKSRLEDLPQDRRIDLSK
jgi:hypothetical protein